MVEEKRKRGRPKKNPNVGYIPPNVSGVSVENKINTKIDNTHRRDDLCIQMLMGIINKQGQIKYDFAKDIFDTATQLAYDFGWMERPKAKKQSVGDPLIEALNNPAFGVIVDEKSHEYKAEALANTPADIFRQLRGE